MGCNKSRVDEMPEKSSERSASLKSASPSEKTHAIKSFDMVGMFITYESIASVCVCVCVCVRSSVFFSSIPVYPVPRKNVDVFFE